MNIYTKLRYFATYYEEGWKLPAFIWKNMFGNWDVENHILYDLFIVFAILRKRVWVSAWEIENVRSYHHFIFFSMSIIYHFWAHCFCKKRFLPRYIQFHSPVFCQFHNLFYNSIKIHHHNISIFWIGWQGQLKTVFQLLLLSLKDMIQWLNWMSWHSGSWLHQKISQWWNRKMKTPQ